MLYGRFSDLFRKVRETEGTVREGGLSEHDFTHGLKTEFSRRDGVWIGVTVTTTQPFSPGASCGV